MARGDLGVAALPRPALGRQIIAVIVSGYDEDQAIGRSRGGLSTKIHALVDALGNPLGFFLTGGEAHDLVGADQLLPTMEADTLIANKAFDADVRVLEPLTAAGKTAVIPLRANRSSPRDYDLQLYGARLAVSAQAAAPKPEKRRTSRHAIE
jgi:hypothetical protein